MAYWIVLVKEFPDIWESQVISVKSTELSRYCNSLIYCVSSFYETRKPESQSIVDIYCIIVANLLMTEIHDIAGQYIYYLHYTV